MKTYSLYESSYYFFQAALDHHNLDFSLNQFRLVREQTYFKNLYPILNEGKDNQLFNQFMLERKKHFQFFDQTLSIWASINFMFTYITLLHACQIMIGAILLNASLLVLIGWTLCTYYSAVKENHRLIGDIMRSVDDSQHAQIKHASDIALTRANNHSKALEEQTMTVGLSLFMYLMVLCHEWFEAYVISEAVFYPAMFSVFGIVFLLYTLMIYDFYQEVARFFPDEDEENIISSSGNEAGFC